MIGTTNANIKTEEEIFYVDWIRSTSSQIIDPLVDIPASSTDIFSIEMTVENEIEQNNVTLFGGQELVVSGYYGLTAKIINNELYFNIENPNITNSVCKAPFGIGKHTIKATFDLSQKVVKATVDNIDLLELNFTRIGELGYYNFTLFGTNNYDNTYSDYSSIKMYNCAIYKNNIIIRRFFPCRDTIGIFCLYDTVSKKYFYNKVSSYFEGDKPIQIEYIEMTGTQWIDTGVIPTNDLDVKIEVSTKTDGNDKRRLLGGRNYSEERPERFTLFFGDYEQEIYCYGQFGATSQIFDVAHLFENDTPALLIFGKSGFSMNGEQIVESWDTPVSGVTYSIYLGALNTAGVINADNYFAGKIFTCQFYENDVLTYDFIPVNIGVNCFYNKLNQKYYYNKGTGDFLGGLDISVVKN